MDNTHGTERPETPPSIYKNGRLKTRKEMGFKEPIRGVYDTVDPSDPHGRTTREINNCIEHKYDVQDLVELDNGVRMFITRLTRDCDGTPLYCMGPKLGHSTCNGYPEDSIDRLIAV